MFGYITADPGSLTQAEIDRYGGCYCGLCRCLSHRHGFCGRMTLTYDMTFLVLVLSSLYEPEETAGSGRCPVHPVKPRSYWQNRFTDYAADLNLMLAWWNCMDDWEDDKNVTSRAFAGLLGKKCRQLEQQYPRQSKAIRENLAALHQYEDGPQVNADAAADCFGNLMGELFVWREDDYWAKDLRAMGQGLGRFIYIMDACIDYHSDERHHRPNPLRALGTGERTRQGDYDLLSMLLGDCTAVFEQLPLEQDLHLMRNILYTGVWQKYNQFDRRHHKGEQHEGNEGEEQS